MRKASFMSFAVKLLLGGLLGFAATSCNQYEYASPSPGILEIKLRVKNTRTDLLPFAPTSAMIMKLSEVEAVQSNNIALKVLADLHAIRRNLDGDFFNCLDTLARDTVYYLGVVYAPPGTYTGLRITAEMLGGVSLFGGTFPNFIEIRPPNPPPPALKTLPESGKSLSIQINENRTTRVTVTLDLDTSLVQRFEWFEGNLKFFVSSIQNL